MTKNLLGMSYVFQNAKSYFDKHIKTFTLMNVSNKDNRKLTLLFTDQVFIYLKRILEGGARSRKIVGGARRCRIGSDGGHHQPEALWPVAVMAPKEAESEVLRKLSALTSLVICLLVIIENIM